ncbi:hydrogenase maturation protease [Microbulbifer echini]|uniref:Hydrogenase maturation protease n=1 Tax=Microbulbifer echini TaxID=1529067 RepID=A0ABV4NT74_9GAMM|nr:hydrogenase maturation protease [uncultured Microbulbifer sp.]
MSNEEVPERWLLISLGNRYRGDDGVGPYLLDRLRSRLAGLVDFLESGGDMARLVGEWKGRQVCLVDAFLSDEYVAGNLVRVNIIGDNDLADFIAPSLCSTSSHGFNLGEAIELGKILQSLPRRLDIFAICAEDLTRSDRLTPKVKTGAQRAEQAIIAFLHADNGGQPCTNSP